MASEKMCIRDRTTQELEQMKSVDIGAVAAESLPDVIGMTFDNALSRKERLSRFLQTVKNPYCFCICLLYTSTMYQEIIESEPENAEKVKQFAAKMCISLKRMEPVSYTHLDVYKRQMIYSIIWTPMKAPMTMTNTTSIWTKSNMSPMCCFLLSLIHIFASRQISALPLVQKPRPYNQLSAFLRCV